MGFNVAARAGGNFLVMSTISNSIIWTGNLDAGTRGTEIWEGHLALNAGEIIRASSTATGAPFFTVTGYLFALP
jgi:acyl CoA:acetate/3-ketoacid CoA transferase